MAKRLGLCADLPAMGKVKLQSCMTLFAEAAPEEEVFQKVLDKYFKGEKDRHTLQILGRPV
ncbi:MAG: DUF1810 domain-containing protein [Clostridiales bacterium]|nr:DUF1810 domain-containing protein [Clostridiales bacterium]